MFIYHFVHVGKQKPEFVVVHHLAILLLENWELNFEEGRNIVLVRKFVRSCVENTGCDVNKTLFFTSELAKKNAPVMVSHYVHQSVLFLFLNKRQISFELDLLCVHPIN